jgi:hypothetical protein
MTLYRAIYTTLQIEHRAQRRLALHQELTRLERQKQTVDNVSATEDTVGHPVRHPTPEDYLDEQHRKI